MKHVEEHISICESCGATIYKEHLDSGIARYEKGKLLCSHCVAEYEQSHDAAAGGAQEDFGPIELDDADDGKPSKMTSTRIHSVTEATLGHGAGASVKFRRPLQPNAGGATRCRTFHCRLSDGAVDFMTTQINEWIDQNDDIVVKFVNSSIGLFEGKHTENNLIVTVFY